MEQRSGLKAGGRCWRDDDGNEAVETEESVQRVSVYMCYCACVSVVDRWW